MLQYTDEQQQLSIIYQAGSLADTMSYDKTPSSVNRVANQSSTSTYSPYSPHSPFNRSKNDCLGSYRVTNFDPQKVSSPQDSRHSEWEKNMPMSIACRNETLHLHPTELRIEDYYLICQQQLKDSHKRQVSHLIQKKCLNERCLRDQAKHKLMTFCLTGVAKQDDIQTKKNKQMYREMVQENTANNGQGYSYSRASDASRNTNLPTNNSAANGAYDKYSKYNPTSQNFADNRFANGGSISQMGAAGKYSSQSFSSNPFINNGGERNDNSGITKNSCSNSPFGQIKSSKNHNPNTYTPKNMNSKSPNNINNNRNDVNPFLNSTSCCPISNPQNNKDRKISNDQNHTSTGNTNSAGQINSYGMNQKNPLNDLSTSNVMSINKAFNNNIGSNTNNPLYKNDANNSHSNCFSLEKNSFNNQINDVETMNMNSSSMTVSNLQNGLGVDSNQVMWMIMQTISMMNVQSANALKENINRMSDPYCEYSSMKWSSQSEQNQPQQQSQSTKRSRKGENIHLNMITAIQNDNDNSLYDNCWHKGSKPVKTNPLYKQMPKLPIRCRYAREDIENRKLKQNCSTFRKFTPKQLPEYQLSYTLMILWKEETQCKEVSSQTISGRISLSRHPSALELNDIVLSHSLANNPSLKKDVTIQLQTSESQQNGECSVNGVLAQRKINVRPDYDYKPQIFSGFEVSGLTISNKYISVEYPQCINVKGIDFSTAVVLSEKHAHIQCEYLDRQICRITFQEIPQKIQRYVGNDDEKVEKLLKNKMEKLQSRNKDKSISFINYNRESHNFVLQIEPK